MPQPDRSAAEHACSAYAPGRVELLGNHTDYNQGVVLGAAIDRGLTVSGAQRNDPIISLISSSDGRFEIPFAELRPQQSNRWANYALGVASELVAEGVPVRGFSAMVDGDLPAGYGLSSSAAFEVATAMFLLKLYQHDLAPLEIAHVCQRAEHRFVGVKSGLLDQVTSIFGQENHVVFFDCRTEEVRRIPFPPGLALIIAESGKKRELAAGKYNERREETAAAAKALGLSALRDASSAEVAANGRLDPTLRRRALHITGENERVFQAMDLLGAGDGEGFGRLMNESHDSSRTNFENSSAELDLLVNIARSIPEVLGSRLTGGGFGGATVSLCRLTNAAQVAKRMASEYVKQSGIHSHVFVCRVAAGAR